MTTSASGTASGSGSGGELGIFLKARRAAVKPSDVGLPSGPGIRRTPGLRREELAALAGVSVDYYTRLERGKETNPSPSVIDALARILQLNPDEHDHLRGLVSFAARPPRQGRRAACRVVRPGVEVLLEALRPNAAMVASRINDILVANPVALALYPGLTDWPRDQWNFSRYLFLHPAAKELYPEWSDIVPGSVAHLRAAAGTNPDDAELNLLIGELVVKSSCFARLWDRYEVRTRSNGLKRLHHPIVGDMHLEYEVMPLANTDGQRLITYFAPAGTPDHDALTLLDMTASAARAASAPSAAAVADPDADGVTSVTHPEHRRNS